MRILYSLSLALLLLALAPIDPAWSGPLVERISADGVEAIGIELDRGDVFVTGHDHPDVRIEATARGLGASSVRFRLRREGSRIVLTGLAEPWLDWVKGGPRVAIRVWVPRGLTVQAETAGGAVRVTGIEGPLALRSGEHRLATRAEPETVYAVSESGRISTHHAGLSLSSPAGALLAP